MPSFANEAVYFWVQGKSVGLCVPPYDYDKFR